MPAVIWLVPRMKYRLAVSGLLLHSYHDLLSSESSFLVRLLPLLLLPSCILLFFSPPSPRSADFPSLSLLQGENFFRGRHCRTFDCVGISALLLLRFPFFLFKFVFFSTAFFLFRAPLSLMFFVCLLLNSQVLSLRDFHFAISIHLLVSLPSIRDVVFFYFGKYLF